MAMLRTSCVYGSTLIWPGWKSSVDIQRGSFIWLLTQTGRWYAVEQLTRPYASGIYSHQKASGSMKLPSLVQLLLDWPIPTVSKFVRRMHWRRQQSRARIQEGIEPIKMMSHSGRFKPPLPNDTDLYLMNYFIIVIQTSWPEPPVALPNQPREPSLASI